MHQCRSCPTPGPQLRDGALELLRQLPAAEVGKVRQEGYRAGRGRVCLHACIAEVCDCCGSDLSPELKCAFLGAHLPQRQERDWYARARALHEEAAQGIIAAPCGRAAGPPPARLPSGTHLLCWTHLAVVAKLVVPPCKASPKSVLADACCTTM